MVTLIAIICVFAIACGQILFKLCAQSYQLHGLMVTKTLTIFTISIALYGLATLAWIWVLSNADLGKVYPLMALAFVFVPVASYFIFNERYSIVYVIGILLIVIGITLTSQG